MFGHYGLGWVRFVGGSLDSGDLFLVSADTFDARNTRRPLGKLRFTLRLKASHTVKPFVWQFVPLSLRHHATLQEKGKK